MFADVLVYMCICKLVYAYMNTVYSMCMHMYMYALLRLSVHVCACCVATVCINDSYLCESHSQALDDHSHSIVFN